MNKNQVITNVEQVKFVFPEYRVFDEYIQELADQWLTLEEMLRLRALYTVFGKDYDFVALLNFCRFKKYNFLSLGEKRILLSSDRFSSGVNKAREYAKKGKVLPPNAYIVADSIGRYKELPNVLKGWLVCKRFSPSLARKVGKMDRQNQILACLAISDEEGKGFWERFKELRKMSALEFVREFRFNLHHKDLLSEYVMNKVGLTETFDWDEADSMIEKYPREFAKDGVGCGGKKMVQLVVRAHKEDKEDHLQWARVLFFGKEDYVQKVLSLEEVVPYQEEAVDMMLTWSEPVRLRMLSATTFKYRGHEYRVTKDYIRDAGYLWSRIRVKPRLGRIRCWFSVHETLSRAYVRELPNKDLPVHCGWERIDGLCGISGDWEIEIPRSVAQLKAYGERLHNCVGGYGDRIESGESIVFAVKEHGVLTHCVEVVDREINQFYSDRNGYPNRQIMEEVIESLRVAGVID